MKGKAFNQLKKEIVDSLMESYIARNPDDYEYFDLIRERFELWFNSFKGRERLKKLVLTYKKTPKSFLEKQRLQVIIDFIYLLGKD